MGIIAAALLYHVLITSVLSCSEDKSKIVSFVFLIFFVNNNANALLLCGNETCDLQILTQPPLDVKLLELVETGEHTSASDTTENVCTSSLHQ